MRTLKRLVAFAGWYSVIGGAPLALPFLTGAVGERLGLAGSSTALLLANTSGLLMVFMGLLLLHAVKDLPNRAGIVALVAVARLLFASLVLYYAVFVGVERFWIIDAVVDSACSVALLHLLRSHGLLRPGARRRA